VLGQLPAHGGAQGAPPAGRAAECTAGWVLNCPLAPCFPAGHCATSGRRGSHDFLPIRDCMPRSSGTHRCPAFTSLQVWYGVPASATAALEEAMRDALPHLFEANPRLLYQLVTMVSPLELQVGFVASQHEQ